MEDDLARHVAEVRAFNRFYTQRIGMLEAGILKSGFSLSEARLLFELAHRDTATATDLCTALHLDAGYVSRLVAQFVESGLVQRRASGKDARRTELRLTKKGRATFASLDASSEDAVRALLLPLGRPHRERITAAMGAIEKGLDRSGRPAEPRATPWILRTHAAGYLGFIFHRHGALYAA
jgi:DNA-binding MarR family transcriptional regulator